MPLLKRFLALTLLASLMLGGCGPSRQVREPTYLETPEAVQAANLYREQHYAEAAAAYRKLADNAPPQWRSPMLLMSAQSLSQDHQLLAAESVLALIDPNRLTPDDQLRMRLMQAEIALGNGQPDQASQLLETAPAPQSPDKLRSRYFNLKAQVAQTQGQPMQQALALEQADLLETDAIERQKIQLELLSALAKVGNEEPSQAPATHKGWMELSRLLRGLRHDPQSALAIEQEWRRLYPLHPALPGLGQLYIDQQAALIVHVKQLAVLLPFSSKHAAAANAIRHGLMSAWLAQAPEQRPELKFYDVSDAQTLWPTLNQAATDGADLAIGPLVKDSVAQLGKSGELPIPVLALNEVPPTGQFPSQLYQYALSPLDEATQIADWAWSNNLRAPALLSQANAKGDRLVDAFSQRWHQLGGTTIIQDQYDPDKKDLAQKVQALLDIDQSQQRHKQLQRILGRNLEFTPSRRGDIDFIFAQGDSNQLAQIKPLLAFYYASDLPVFSTSDAWDGNINQHQLPDLEGLALPDIPWLLIDGSGALTRAQVAESFPDSTGLLRLYAMGMDAYALGTELKRLESGSHETYSGATGVLHLNNLRQIRRQMTWLKLEQQPRVLGVTPWLDAPAMLP